MYKLINLVVMNNKLYGINHLKISIQIYYLNQLLKQKITKKSNKVKSIQDCLDLFQKQEVLDGWYCSHCNDIVTAQNQLKIYKAPKILIFHLNRFKTEYSSYGVHLTKNNEMITAPIDELDLTDYVDNPDLPNAYFNDEELKYICNSVKKNKFSDETNQDNQSLPESMKAPKHKSGQKLLYRLVAVSNHYGSLSSGHYTAYARAHETQWYSYNDEYVRNIEQNAIISESSYILFQERI